MKYIFIVFILLLFLGLYVFYIRKTNKKTEYKSFLENKDKNIINPTIGLQQKATSIVKTNMNDDSLAFNKKLPHQIQKNGSLFNKNNLK